MSSSSNWIDKLQTFCDTHIQEFKLCIYGLGAVGIILIFRDLQLVTKFCKATQIPDKFFSSHVTLQGQVHKINAQGVLHVQHQPIFTLPFSRRISHLHSSETEGLLPVSLFGVKTSEQAVQWLSTNLHDKHVWFQLLFKTEDAMVCSVRTKKNLLFKLNVNQKLIELGLASVAETIVPPSLGESPIVPKILDQLRATELRARKQRIGIWKETKIKTIKSKSSLLRRLLNWLAKKVKEKFY